MSKAPIRAPSRASASAVALPWPCAAPVTKATFPANSPSSLLTRAGRTLPYALAIGLEILVEIHLERIVDDVGGHHERPERGEYHDLSRGEVSARVADIPRRTP